MLDLSRAGSVIDVDGGEFVNLTVLHFYREAKPRPSRSIAAG